MKQIQIQVSASLKLFSEGKFLYRHVVSQPLGIDFPFSKVLDSLHVLYGSNCVIQFLEV